MLTKAIKFNSKAAFPLLCLAAAFLWGCSLQVRATGGGLMESADQVPTDNAVFTVNGSNCGMTPISNEDFYEFPSKGVVNYQDLTAPGGPVMFHGTVTQIDQCLSSTYYNGTPPPACTACSVNYFGYPIFPKLLGGYGAEVSYTSTNTSNPGSGTAYVCVISPGQGPNNPAASDWVAVVGGGDSGPYADYVNVGPLEHGNIHAINCPAPQTVGP